MFWLSARKEGAKLIGLQIFGPVLQHVLRICSSRIFYLPDELRSHASHRVRHAAIGVGRLTVDERHPHDVLESLAFHRRPTAVVEQILACDAPRRGGVDQHKVGVIARTDVAAAVDVEEVGGIVRHLLHHLLTCHDAARGIPYATTFDLNNKPLLTLHETFKAILKDLDTAESLLADDNEVNVEQTPSSDYLKGRAVFFNKYAVAATKARVYYAMGDTANAAKYARLVIAATSNFSLKKLTSMADVKRFPATGELIFGLYNNTLSADISSTFLSQTARGTFTEGRRDLEELYETSAFSATSADLRYTGYYRQNTTPDGIKTYSFVRLLESDAQVNSSPLQGLTLIRLPEMYYILSECTYDNNKAEAVRLLNVVRTSRGLEAVADAKVADRTAFDKEMLRERMREMPGEGQTFFALKHYNKAFGDYRGINTYQPSSAIFVLPWPEREKEYGGQ